MILDTYWQVFIFLDAHAFEAFYCLFPNTETIREVFPYGGDVVVNIEMMES